MTDELSSPPFRIYYQDNPQRLPTCTLPLHALLHIAQSIRRWGPVWCYWAFPMERYGGHEVKPGITSRRFPYSSLDQYVLRKTRLRQLGIIYGISEQLKLQAPEEGFNPQFQDCKPLLFSWPYLSSLHLDPTCQFFSPKSTPLESRLQKSVEEALTLRFGVEKKEIQRLLKLAAVEQWGRVRVTDTETDDMIWAAALRPTSEDQREASYVRVSD
jgi:hypothetical protein